LRRGRTPGEARCALGRHRGRELGGGGGQHARCPDGDGAAGHDNGRSLQCRCPPRAVLLAPPNAILVLQKGCTYRISELLPINQNMTIDGNGDTVDATALAFTAIWNKGFDFTVEHLTVRHGIGDRIRAGAIQNDPGGNVTITDCIFTQNLGGAGGSLINLPGATMAVSNSSFTDNDAYDAGGGAIANFGTMTISGSTFSSNTAIYDPLVPPLPRARSAAPAEQAPGDGTGGAIGNFGGDLTLSGASNTAGGTGGGINRTGGTVSLTHGVLVLLNRPNNCTGLAC
jgi:hypothetical protein